MAYNPESTEDRAMLAATMRAMLSKAGFAQVERPGTKEKVFAREVPNTGSKIRVLVYTSIEGSMTRECGDDAIRVCAVYKARDGQERGIAAAEKRINRVGNITDITDRLLVRMREVWASVKTAERCSCGAPKFKAKSKKLCCADLCWKRPEDIGPAAESYARYGY